MRLDGAEVSLPKLEFVLPMGISFYTFASLSYTIDIYRREIRPVKRFLGVLFLCSGFFPHLVAGPIVRAANFLPLDGYAAAAGFVAQSLCSMARS